MKTKPILLILTILSGMLFVGLSIVAGAYVVNMVFALIKPELVPKLMQQADLSDLYRFNKNYYFLLHVFLSIVAILKVVMFYFITFILMDKRLNIQAPFNKLMERFITKLSFISLLIGITSLFGSSFTERLIEKGVKMPQLQQMHIGGADVWLFMAIILIVITQVFKRGMELQTENDLTV